ncbi:NUDIX domain-containing protein [SAR92 clade bacterium H455]|uniref:ADP-ribose pyrophosphatase n=1 Tax=SAR92 clade bacterium H455 TaxID=2974818 RepID=A0ABY5TNF6_9GAMM|nr:NUDIX domain-containing protein [SAR92 clade bacterium H455]
MDKKHRFGPSDYRLKSTETVFQGFFKMTRMTVEHRLFGGGWSKPLRRELFQRGDAVGVLLYDPRNHRVGLIEQFRPGALNEARGPWQYEVIAGMIEPGESLEQVAARELEEESGVEVEKLLPICDYLVSSGGTDEKMHLFCGLADLRERGGIFGVDRESEDILLHVWSYAETMEAFSQGLLNSAAMSVALFWLQLNHQQLRLES